MHGVVLQNRMLRHPNLTASRKNTQTPPDAADRPHRCEPASLCYGCPMFQPDLLKAKRILVTGGGTGLGLSMGRRFLELGAELVICGRREQVLAEAAAKLTAETGGRVETHGCDVRDAAAVEAMLEKIWADRPARRPRQQRRRQLHRPHRRPVAARHRCRAEHRPARQRLRHRSAAASAGSPPATRPACSASSPPMPGPARAMSCPRPWPRPACSRMTRSLAVEWGGRGVRLNAIAPGPFPTPGAWERLVPRPDLARDFETTNPLGRVRRARRAGRSRRLPAVRQIRLHQRRGRHHRRRRMAAGRRPVQLPEAPDRRGLGRAEAEETGLTGF